MESSPLSLLGQHSETSLGHHQSHSPYPCGLDLSVPMRSPFLLSCQEHTYIARWRDPSMKTQLSRCVCILSPSPSSPHPLSFLFSDLPLPTPIYFLPTSSFPILSPSCSPSPHIWICFQPKEETTMLGNSCEPDIHWYYSFAPSSWHGKGCPKDEDVNHPRLSETPLPGCAT